MNSEIKHKWVCIALPDNLERDWNFKPQHKPFIEGIDSVYFYDANEATRLCELTPSYFLRSLHRTIKVLPNCSEEMREEIYEAYGFEPMEDIYMHCSAVERLQVPKVEWTGDTEATEQEVQEYWQGNHVL